MDEADFYKPRPRMSRSVWDVYSFAWHPANLRVLLLLSADMTMLALIACGFATLHGLVTGMEPEKLMSTGGEMVVVGSSRVGGSLIMLTILGSVYIAGSFLHVIQDSAAGAREIEWESWTWIGFLGWFLYVIWVIGCCAVVAAILLVPLAVVTSMPKLPFVFCQSLILLFIFPPVLLSTLAGGSPFMLIE